MHGRFIHWSVWAAFQMATTNISAINEVVYTEIVGKVFMTTSHVAEVEDERRRPKTDGEGVPQTVVRMGTYGGGLLVTRSG